MIRQYSLIDITVWLEVVKNNNLCKKSIHVYISTKSKSLYNIYIYVYIHTLKYISEDTVIPKSKSSSVKIGKYLVHLEENIFPIRK